MKVFRTDAPYLFDKISFVGDLFLSRVWMGYLFQFKVDGRGAIPVKIGIQKGPCGGASLYKTIKRPPLPPGNSSRKTRKISVIRVV